MHETSKRPKNPQRPLAFQGALRAHLAQRLISLTQRQVDGVPDRVVDLQFANGARLHVRLTGRTSGVWLFRDDQIVASLSGKHYCPPLATPAPPKSQGPRFPLAPGPNQSADRFFQREERRQRDQEQRSLLRQRLRREHGRLRRLVANLSQDHLAGLNIEHQQHKADLLANHLHDVVRGATEVEVYDYNSGEQRTIQLRPDLSPSENLQRMYRKAARLRAGKQSVQQRLANAKRDEERVTALRSRVDEMELGEVAGHLKQFKGRKQQSGPSKTPWATWTGPTGVRVRVGKNSKGNRMLTFSKAAGHHIWLHVRGTPGAHVVIELQRNKTPSLDLLLQAAQIVLATEGVQKGVHGEVQYALVKDVKPVPGEVSLARVANEKVLHVERDPKVLQGWTREG